MSSVVPALLQLAALFALLALTVPLFARYLAHVYTPRATWRRSGSSYRVLRVDPDAEQHWRSLPDCPSSASRWSGSWCSSPSAGSSSTCRCRSAWRRSDRRRLEHRRLLRHQHQLAVVLRRGRPRAPLPDGRPRGAELRVRRRRHGRGGRPRARVRPVGHRTAASATSGPTWSAASLRVLLPISRGRRRWRWSPPASSRTSTAPQVIATLAGGSQTARRAGGLPGGHQGARHQRRRLLQRQLRPPVREPEPVDQPARGLPLLLIPFALALDVRPDRRRPPPGLGGPRRDGDPARRPPSACSPGPRWPARALHPAAAGGAMEGKEVRFGEAGVGAVRAPPRRARRPARSTPCTTR